MDDLSNLIQNFRDSPIWKILLPLAIASDTMGLYSVVPESVKQITSIPAFSYLLLYIFVVETGADPIMSLGFIAVLYVLNMQEAAAAQSVLEEDDD